MSRRRALFSLASGAIVAILTVPAHRAIAARSKEATVTLEIRGMV